MENSRKFLNPQTLARLHGLQLRARHIVEGFVAGLHRSPFHGFSIEFAEHREYAPGDDLKHVDWRVFGRTDKFYLKQYEDETNLVCHLVVDGSESMHYKGPNSALSKWETAQCAAASLAWLVLKQQDAISLSVFDSALRSVLRPSSSTSHLQQVLHVLEHAAAGPNSALGPVFHELAGRLTKRGVVIVLSDLFDNVDQLLKGLAHLTHARHDVLVLHVLDEAELTFPFRRGTLFRGLEQGPQVLTEPQALRTAYLREFNQYRDRVQAGCRAHGIDYRLLRTDQPLDLMLASVLHQRAAHVD